MTSSRILASLNPAQREAVSLINGPGLVLAGAGTGKTRVITYRVAHLIANGIRPESLLVVTFTNKAAREMRERAAQLIGAETASRVTMCTFHSLCLQILKIEIKKLGYAKRFSVYGRSEQLGVVKKAMNSVVSSDGHMKPEDVLGKIGHYKNRGILPDKMNPDTDRETYVWAVYRHYQRSMKTYNAIDFDDMLLLTIQLFKKNPDVLEKYQKRFKFISIDEYQDTNGVQYQLAKMLAGKNRNIFVVGDDDQSIYAFRGAIMGNILRFDKDYKGAKVIKLEENYRSTNNILGAANSVIKVNSERYEKHLFSGLGEGEKIELHTLEDGAEEADYVSSRIISLLKSGARHNQIAVLIRSASQARAFEERFRDRMIPYKLSGGQSFYERKEILDVLAYLHVIVNPADELSIRRVVNYPTRGVGDKSIAAIAKEAAERKKKFHTVLEDADWIPASLSPQAVKGIDAFYQLVKKAREDFKSGDMVLALKELIEATGIKEEIVRTSKDDMEMKLRHSNIDELVNAMAVYVSRNSKPTLDDFVQKQSLLTSEDTENESDETANQVTLSTIHSAKGLEWDVVFLPGVEEGFIPHKRSVDDENDPHESINEERRLFYVAITRARRRLVMSHCSGRMSRGRPVEREISRFVDDIDEKFLTRGEGKGPVLDSTAGTKKLAAIMENLKKQAD